MWGVAEDSHALRYERVTSLAMSMLQWLWLCCLEVAQDFGNLLTLANIALLRGKLPTKLDRSTHPAGDITLHKCRSFCTGIRAASPEYVDVLADQPGLQAAHGPVALQPDACAN